MGIGGWFKEQRRQALEDKPLLTLWSTTPVLSLHEHTIRSGQTVIPLDGATMTLESGSELSSRITATRLVALGIFAIAAKKKTGGEQWLTIENGDELLSVEVPHGKSRDVHAFMARARQQGVTIAR